MKLFYSDKVKRYVSLAILGCFAFYFLHSELDFLNYDDSFHGEHDYCQIIKNSNSHTKLLRDKLPKPELKKDIIYVFSAADEPPAFKVCSPLSNPAEIPGTSGEIFIFNRVLLI